MIIRTAWVLAIATAGLAIPLSAGTIILPSACASVDCPGTTATANLPVPFELQQIFDASMFTGITGPITVTGISLRPAPTVNTATSAVLNMTLKEGTTSTDPNAGCTALSPGTNAGCTYTAPLSTAGDTTIFSGDETFSTTNTGSPRGFDYGVPLTTSFTYNPEGGSNLLLDLTIAPNGLSSNNGNLVFEAIGGSNRQSGTGAVTSSALTGSAAASGLVVELTYSQAASTPEPGTLVLLGAGFAAAGLLRRRRTKGSRD